MSEVRACRERPNPGVNRSAQERRSWVDSVALRAPAPGYADR